MKFIKLSYQTTILRESVFTVYFNKILLFLTTKSEEMKSYEFELFVMINRHEDPSFPIITIMKNVCGYIVMQLTWICLLNSLKLLICFVYIFRIPRSREPIRMPFLSQKHEFHIIQVVPWSKIFQFLTTNHCKLNIVRVCDLIFMYNKNEQT